ncbi:MAG: proprotein convertase P-domain-containing protein [Bdellovibrionales bacterium]|nr:proprotein convertase P-domain-containing protein [Bdellovibrionales bacterium]
MKKTLVVLAGCCTLFCATAGSVAREKSRLDYAVQNSAHTDGRLTPKLEFEPDFQSRAGLSGEALAREYLRARASRYGLKATLENLALRRTQASLYGKHYHFQQQIHGIDVEAAEIIVSVRGNRVYRIFNNTFPVKDAPKRVAKALSVEQAYDQAWNSLQVRGKLMAKPDAQLLYVLVDAKPVLAYQVDLSVENPHGAWRVTVDASSGAVLSKVDRVLPRGKSAQSMSGKRAHGPLLDRLRAFRAYDNAQSARSLKHRSRATGSGFVFDPDPRTTLMDNTLKDDSSADKFEGAYYTRTLQDISFADSKYSLVGPWVQIVDFESPTNAPSTTTDGSWTAKRGNNAFNDVMTYYHVDKNQRYMQSLGFTGEKGIQEASIEVDSDGYGGSDNSYFSPVGNKIAFGHGCVDDNEDSDVILHEYGHAIHHSINSNWSGGDTGAMGEGFGDYWAASYSLSTPNGDQFNKNHVFNWDGHGEGNPCWPGRVLDAFGAQYDSNKTYGAHQTITGGFQSDELWSTPLFQSLLALMQAGVSKEAVDTIILEAHFGLGSGLKMPEMAKAILATAQNLQDNPGVGEAFLSQFVKHKILEVPTPALQNLGFEFKDSGGNGSADPGESLELLVPIKNVGTASGSAVTAVLSSSDPNVRVLQAQAHYGDIAMGAVASQSGPFVVELDSALECGKEVTLNLHVQFEKGRALSTDVTLTIPTGVAQGAALSVEPKVEIPDNDENGIVQTLELNAEGTVSNLSVKLDITHPYRGDLAVSLESPAGTKVLLHDRTGGSEDNLQGVYPQSLVPVESLSKLDGEALNGTWKLHVSDHANSDKGVLNSWGVSAVTGYVCQ